MSAKRQSNDKNTGKCSKKDKRGESAIINPDIEDTVIQNGMRDAWKKKTSYSHGSIELDCEPFPHCKIRNFIQNESFAQSLQDELLQLNFNNKSNDLYKFQQSDDLKKRKEHHISEIRSLIFVQFRSWLAEVLGVDLEPTVDISCAKYEHTDVLLCHDDELEGRRVAFILYLVPPWDLSNGGTLDLYSTDEHYQPVSIVKSLLPSWNTLMFFEVSPVSFHQVAEVLAEGKCRLSLSGWFHGPSLPRPPRYIEPLIPRHTHIPRDENVLFEWVNETYMDPLYQAQVQQEFEDNSEIRLPNFLQEEKFKQVSEALRLAEVQWERRGPPNKRCYARAELQSIPACLKECWDLLSSEPFFLLLSNLTGLSLHYLAVGDEENESDSQGDESYAEKGKEKRNNQGGQGTSSATSSNKKKDKGPPMCVGELCRWAHGDYTLLHDSVEREFALDLLLHLGCKGWKAEFGGFTSYIAHDEDEELLTVYPEDNSLALVYRDKETLRFVKHINHSSTDQKDAAFYDFSFTYYE
ncbi:prolyl 3-hydroxylase OGFOD1 [Colossoma macropomum]|uniref:prolyl 3-hydroxylase OGFOD1 n=1 Tax=Colossoma macropomum TaxID=42526 RepID=UPI00186506B2|nr:prolyl 3-hydroxylase OGFOD1 [Colossoma macropomum]